MNHGKQEEQLFEARVEELRTEQSDDSLARLVWTTVLLRRMRTAAIRAARTEALAPLDVVLASSRLRRRAR